MKALIFNSGVGKRMGELTKNCHKSMVKLRNGETLFERQIRLLSECGIKEFIITTGPYEEQFIEISKKEVYKDLIFKFVHNPVYNNTNYIYSCYLAREYLNDDIISLHGDLVFDKELLLFVLNDENKSTCLINEKLELPQKDFKGRIVDGKLREVGINIFDENCFALQPLYKLAKKDVQIWVDSIVDFVENKKIDGVYAENAFNVISENTNIIPLSYENYYINEIDNPEDYEKVSREIAEFDYKEQKIENSINQLPNILNKYNCKKPLVVIDLFLKNSEVCSIINKCCNPVYFSDFQPNPLYEDVVKVVKLYKENNCDSIISIGGGSAIDTAKAVKLFLPLNSKENYLSQKHIYCNIKHIAIPTTAGTGSESTKYSVIYYNGEKQSLSNDELVPDVAILESKFLRTLPLNQKKATVFDALCQAIESIWSVNSTKTSIRYAKESIKLILDNVDNYFKEKDDDKIYSSIAKASNLAGKAINITQTTAAHAMSYKLTSLYRIPHGQAVAMCMSQGWEYLIKNSNKTFDPRGEKDLKYRLKIVDDAFGGNALKKFEHLLQRYEICKRISTKEDILILVSSVNPVRLKNYPVVLSKDIIKDMYLKIGE